MEWRFAETSTLLVAIMENVCVPTNAPNRMFQGINVLAPTGHKTAPNFHELIRTKGPRLGGPPRHKGKRAGRHRRLYRQTHHHHLLNHLGIYLSPTIPLSGWNLRNRSLSLHPARDLNTLPQATVFPTPPQPRLPLHRPLA